MKYALILILVFFSCQKSSNQLSLPNLFSDGMVMQRDTTISIWGTSDQSELVKIVTSWGNEATAISDSNGNWISFLKTTHASGPFSLTISAGKEKLYIEDILLGEVWLAAGQSNMEMNFSYCCNTTDSSEHELLNANYPEIRIFNVKKQYNLNPMKEVKGHWTKAIGDSIKNFSAVAYFFAKKLHKKINIPIGIIHSSWGGSDAESWISQKKLKMVQDFKEDSLKPMRIISSHNSEDWFSKFKSVKMPSSGFDLTLATYFERADPGINYLDYFIDYWRNIDFEDSDYIATQNNFNSWSTLELPGSLSNIYHSNDFNGVTILKNEFTIEIIKNDYNINIGTVTLGWAGDLREYDFYINGKKIGSTFGDKKKGTMYYDKLREDYKNNYKKYPFTYHLNQLIPDSCLKVGNNEIAIRVIGSGDIGLISLASNDSVNLLDNLWHYKVSAEIYKQLDNYEYPYASFYLYGDSDINIKKRPSINSYNFNEPSSLFNGMINPLIPYTIRGIIWYQGENNAFRFDKYEKLFSSLIEDWRENWENDLPFYYVQIAPYFNYYGTNAYLREAQRKVLKTPKTGMVVTLDIGENYDIHPSNKHDVGYRLARLAIKNQYGGNQIESGPLFKKTVIIKDKINIFFSHIGSGLIINENRRSEFEISGEDKQYFKANVINKGMHLEVFSEKVNKPIYVRYAWSDTSSATLFNVEGLPASSFSNEFE